MKTIGLDLGTKHIVMCFRDKKGELKFRWEVNGFVDIKKQDKFTKNLLVSSQVPFIEREDDLIALGSKAEDIAYSFNKDLRRPMAEGVIQSDEEEDVIQLMATIVRSIIGSLDDDAVLYYSVPGKPLNSEINVGFHSKVVKMIVDSYDGEGNIESYPINEARAIVLTEEDKTAIGISFGAGMVNVCYSLFGVPIFEFSLVGSGDWIDRETASKFSKETVTSVCKRKHNIDLSEMPSNNIDRAIYINYQILIEEVARGIVQGFKENEDKARVDRPMPIIFAGGTSMPKGFADLFREEFQKQNIPFEIGEVKHAEQPLYTVAKGCFVAAEMHQSD